MANSTLQNLKDSAFVRTDPVLATRIGRYLLHFPDQPFNVYDPSSGEGDLFYAIAHANPPARLFGTEISEERAGVSRQRWPQATILTCAFEAVNVPAGSIALVINNPPYFLVNGKRAEYRFIVDAGESLMPGGIMVAIIPARSAWDGTMINHWLRWYDDIGVWKFPNRTRADQEGAFDDYTQIVVIGVRRAEPQIPSATEKSRLVGYHWRDPEKAGQSGWKHGEPPPDIPDAPMEQGAYRVPSSRQIPNLIVRNADEATLLYALDKSGAHLAPSWQKVTEWPEEGYQETLAMPITGEAHIAAEVMVGALDGHIVRGPGTGPDAKEHLFTAFVGQEWVEMQIEDELLDKLREQGCVSVKLRQLMDKPILGVLNLHSGSTRYYQSEEVFTFLQPWLPTLAARVIERRQPLYKLDPADWEITLLSQFGTDKRLPKATYAGLAVPQMHRVLAMCRSMDVRGRTAIQGEPGTGKTRMAAATAARQAYRWMHRDALFKHSIQPAWIRRLRQSWLQNPRTLAMLNLSPVYGWRIGEACETAAADILEQSPAPHIVAYRDSNSGQLVAPENAGPKALPVLITTPLKVTKEYGKEVLASFPRAEVVHIETHRDIARWLERCAQSSAPVVFGIFSHSTTRAFGREWIPAVREKLVTRRVPDLDPPDDLLPELEPVYERNSRDRKPIAYRFRETDRLLTKKVTAPYYYCWECGGLISAVPGKTHQPDEEDSKKKGKAVLGKVQANASEKEGRAEKKEEKKEPVTSLTWFKIKQRWCTCPFTKRNEERLAQGKPPLRAALWTDERLATTRRKYPSCSFRDWSAVMTNLKHEAERTATHASARELVEHVRRDDRLLSQLVDTALSDPEAAAAVLELVVRIDGRVSALQAQTEQAIRELGERLLAAAMCDAQLLRDLTQEALSDQALLDRLVQHALPYAHQHAHQSESDSPSVSQSMAEMQEHLRQLQAQVVERVSATIQQEQAIVLLLDVLKNLLTDRLTKELLISGYTIHEPDMKFNVEALQHQQGGERALLHLLSRCAMRNQAFCALVVRLGLQDESGLAAWLLAEAQAIDYELSSLCDEIQQERTRLLEMIVEAAGQNASLFRQVIEETLHLTQPFDAILVSLARRDKASLKHFVTLDDEGEEMVRRMVDTLNGCEAHVSGAIVQAARRDGSHSILLRLVERTRSQIDWSALHFRAAIARMHLYSQANAGKAGKAKKSGGSLGSSMEASVLHSSGGVQPLDVRLIPTASGPMAVTRADLDAAKGYDEVRDAGRQVVAYQMGHQGRLLVPIYGIWSRRVCGYVDQQTGKLVTRETSYGFGTPPADSFSPYEYLYTFFQGCVALSVVDESHNGRNRTTDIGHSHHFAMLSAQLRELTSGTHYGGDILGFYHYWYRFNPRFWQRLGFGWEDAETALSHYGVVQEWTKEYETDARKGSGQTDVHVSTIPAPGLSAKLIPHLLEDLTYLTVLDVGAHMPPKKEIPKGISMNDPLVEEAVKQVRQAYADARQQVHEIAKEREALVADELMDEQEREALLAELEGREKEAKRVLEEAGRRSEEVQRWAQERNLADHYAGLAKVLEDLAGEGNAAARLAKGTIPRWYAALPCESAFEVRSTTRSDWGDVLGSELIARSHVLAWDYTYPMERWMIETVRAELDEGRRIMIYFEQNAVRNKAKRLEWVLNEFHPWILPNSVEAEDRQQAIIDAVEKSGHRVVIVPYKRVNEGLNLHTVIDTIIWDELAMNLFMYYQASQRAWRLGKENEVRIYLPFYVGTAVHTKLRKLGGQSGAAAAFAGEPAKGELIHHVGADKTTLARLSASLQAHDGQATGEMGELGEEWVQDDVEADLAAIEANFARRNQELQEALSRGRVWFGLVDSLPERLAAIMAMGHPDVWVSLPHMVHLPEAGIFTSDAGLRARGKPSASYVEGSITSVTSAHTEEDEVPSTSPGTVAAQPVDASVVHATEEREVVSPAVVAFSVADTPVRVVAMIFGSEEDIRRVRNRRKTSPRVRPKPKNQTQLKHIPSVVEQQMSAARNESSDNSDLELLPWWDLQAVTTNEADGTTLTLSTVPVVSSKTLWE